MCGIVGSVNLNWSKDPLMSISHRGPDSKDYFKKNNIFFGHTRLSIQDLSSSGNQPMSSLDGRFIIVYNGEIYNHWDIRKKLTKKGYRFTSKSDTETLLYSWSEWKEESLQYLNGIFSFAVFDIKKNKISIVRDQYGVKPLYIYKKGNAIAFSSEIKSFLSISDFDFTLDYNSIINYLTFLWSPGSKTMYKYVEKLVPGKIIEVDLDRMDITYKNGSFRCQNFSENNDLSEQDWVNKIDDALNKAVERQMLSDAPLGFFLSGGLDSSLLVGIAKSQFPNRKFECFTVDQYKNSKGEGFLDDLPFAIEISKRFDVSLNIIDNSHNWVSEFDKMVWHLDEPQADLAPISVFKICERAKKMGIKVLIGGTGGDDIFSGYRRHQALMINEKTRYMPKIILSYISKIIRSLPSANKNIGRLQRLSRDWGASDFNHLMGYFNWLPSNKFAYEILNKQVRDLVGDYNPYSFGINLLKKQSNLTKLSQMLYLEQKTFLIDHNLNYTDKLSMSQGVEVRVPFLDLNIVKVSNYIPDHFKMKKNIPKYILKKVGEKYLPKKVIYRSKTGFGAPIKNLIKNDFDGMIKKELNRTKIENQGIFNFKMIKYMLSENKSNKHDFSHNILSLLSLQSWLKQFPWR